MKKLPASLGIAVCAVLVVCTLRAVYSTPTHVQPPSKPTTQTVSVPLNVRHSAETDDAHARQAGPTRLLPESLPESMSGQGTARDVAARQSTITINNKQYPQRTYRSLQIPNDPQANQGWVSNAKLYQAWDTPRGAQQTTLAIIDTGFGLKHEEFTDRWYMNPGESGTAAAENSSVLNCTGRGRPLNASCNLIDDNGDSILDNETGPALYENPSRLNCTAQSKPLSKSCNLIDDDSNGFTDDVSGWDFINFDNSPQAGELNPAGTGTTHGTLVSGVAAATGNNGKGIAGADWGTKILPLQALDDDSYGNTGSVGRAIYYAIAQGADVISVSLGSDEPDSYVEEAVKAATAAGIVIVAAAGNDGCDCMVYPAHYPEVVAVGALNASNQRASFSSWGDDLDIMAPGTGITSSVWKADDPMSAYASNASGTSFAAPMVGGMMTRLLSQQPAATPLQLIAALTENTNRLTIPAATPHDSLLGFGGLDAQKATLRMSTPMSAQQLYAFEPISRGSKPMAITGQSVSAEAPGSYLVYQCPDGVVGTTPIYELNKPSNGFFSVSKSEMTTAVAAGYTRSVFAYGCVTQPHDTVTAARNINIYKEFRNNYAAPK